MTARTVVRALGIDPGVTGAWALIEVDKSRLGRFPRVLAVGDLPVTAVSVSARAARKVDAAALEAALSPLLVKADIVTVERLSAAPRISSTAAFSLGYTAGTIDAVLAKLGCQPARVSPSVWKRALLVPADKTAARQRASALFGGADHWPRESDHNRAEAALLALYGALTVGMAGKRRNVSASASASAGMPKLAA